MERRQTIGIAVGAALGSILVGAMFEILALGSGALGAGIGGGLGPFLGGALSIRRTDSP